MPRPPKDHKRPTRVRVLTVNMSDTTKPTDDRVIDCRRESDKTWMRKHIDWAVRNGHGVQIAPEK